VTDISAVAKVAKKHNALLVVDNTFLTMYFQVRETSTQELIKQILLTN